MQGGELDLIEGCVRGDAWAWRELVARHRPAVVRVLVRASGSVDEAHLADLEQELWSRLLARDCEVLRRLRGHEDASVRSFLCTTALNLARDLRRRNLVRPETGALDPEDLDGVATDPAHDPEVLAASAERRRQVLDAALAEGADDRQLLVLALYYFDGRSASEIAAFPGVDLAPKGVETLVHRLTSKVKRRLGLAG